MLLLLTGIDPIITTLAALSLVIILLSLLVRKLRQPYVIAYVLAGIVLGPDGLGLLTNKAAISNLGSLGLILLLFFVGTEISVPNLVKNFKKPLLGALFQVGLSLMFMSLFGLYMKWKIEMIILLGFVISLSSSAVIFRYLIENNEIHSELGHLVSGILLFQDIIVVPMLVVLNFMGSSNLETHELAFMTMGAMFILLFLRMVIRKKEMKLPFPKEFEKDHELQVFAGMLICFGFSVVTALFGLSAALGAFVAGVVVSQTKSTHWLQQNLMPFQVFFLALFFISVGLLIDIEFLNANYKVILSLVILVFVINSLINSIIFRMMKISWRNSIYAGALLSQIGEFSFVLCVTSHHLKLIGDYSYQITLSVIALTMLMTSVWINVVKIFVFNEPSSIMSFVQRWNKSK